MAELQLQMFPELTLERGAMSKAYLALLDALRTAVDENGKVVKLEFDKPKLLKAFGRFIFDSALENSGKKYSRMRVR